MKLQGKYEKFMLEIIFVADIYEESYDNGVLDYINTWNINENFIIKDDIRDIVKSIKDFMENHLYYDWKNLKGIEYDEYVNSIQSNMLVDENNEELLKSEYEEFKNGKNFYSLNFNIKLKINDEDIEDKDLENVIKEIQKTFED